MSFEILLKAIDNLLEKQKVGFHKHDGFQEHPVAVKHHQEYFSRGGTIHPTQADTTEATSTLETTTKRPKWLDELANYPRGFNSLPIAANILKKAGIERSVSHTTAIRGYRTSSSGIDLYGSPFSNEVRISFTTGTWRKLSPEAQERIKMELSKTKEALINAGFKVKSESEYGEITLIPDYSLLSADDRKRLHDKALSYSQELFNQMNKFAISARESKYSQEAKRLRIQRDKASFEASRMEEIAKDIERI